MTLFAVNPFHVFIRWALGGPIESVLRPYFRKITMTLETLEARLQGISDQLGKASGEIVGEIAQLREQLDNAGQLPDGARALLESIEAKAQALDDIVPDAAPPAEPEDPGAGDDTGNGEG